MGPYRVPPIGPYIGPYNALYRAVYRALFRALFGCPIVHCVLPYSALYRSTASASTRCPFVNHSPSLDAISLLLVRFPRRAFG